MNKRLGQFMTPTSVAKLVAQELGPCDTVIDFAVGEGALLNAVQRHTRRAVKLYGFDIDPIMIERAQATVCHSTLKLADGLLATIDENLTGRFGVVGNPPFLVGMENNCGWLKQAFKGLSGKLGTDRTEIQFLARALVAAREFGGRVVLVMPIGFADGDVYRRIRACLMNEYHLVKAIEIASGHFEDTEARTVVLVIDTKSKPGGETAICEFSEKSSHPVHILTAALEAGIRLDARYHKAMRASRTSAPQLGTMHVSIVRGAFSRKEAEKMKIVAFHTSDLSLAKDGKFAPDKLEKFALKNDGMVTARKGDILLARTGSRVRWEPVLVASGVTPITDHIFRIRAPKALREVVYQSFLHPSFTGWLEGVSKGVCATVLTKRELLQMPLFAYIS